MLSRPETGMRSGGATAALVGLGTAVPPGTISQADALAMARETFASRYAEFERLAAVFQSSGIAKRHAVRPIEWYREVQGWPERSAAYLEDATELWVAAATRALDDAGLKAAEVDVAVTVSSTGIATPSLEARAMDRLGLLPSVRRIPVFGLGCAGGVTGLSIAADLARARPGANVLLVAVELCTLAFRRDELTKSNIVATALFGDGAAACILRAGTVPGAKARVSGSGEYLWPDTLDLMGWSVDEAGLGVIFARAIPPFARANIAAATISMLSDAGLAPDDIGRFVCHPGGTRVVEALEAALRLAPDSLDCERSVLRDFGNMSAPTVFFVLERALAAGLKGRSALLALGPGFTASLAVLEVTV